MLTFLFNPTFDDAILLYQRRWVAGGRGAIKKGNCHLCKEGVKAKRMKGT